VTRDRPTARDAAVGEGWPVVASRQRYPDRSAPSARPVTHSQAALLFHTGGRTRVEQNGEWTLGAGDMLVVPAGEPHRMLELRGSEGWGLSFCVPCFAAGNAAALLAPIERVRDGGSAVVHVPSARHAFLEDLFRELEEIGAVPRRSGDALDAVQRSLLTLVLAEIDRAVSSSESRAPRGGGVVVESLRYIERNCLRRLTLDEIAAAVGRTPTYVTTALTQATGRSAGDWIASGRMAEARRLLLHSDEMIDVIAERVGYADATHFIRMFRRVHGATPAAWRASQAEAGRAE